MVGQGAAAAVHGAARRGSVGLGRTWNRWLGMVAGTFDSFPQRAWFGVVRRGVVRPGKARQGMG